MDMELTGNETPEELESLIDGLGEVEIVDDDHPEPTAASPTDTVTEPSPTNTASGGEGQDVPTPGMTTAPTAEERDKPQGILSKDGQHVIPYDVLEAERADKQRWVSTNQQAVVELADVQRQLAVLTHQIKAAGMQPAALPENAQITPEQINGIREDFPEMAAMFDTLVQKIDYLQQSQPTPTSHQTARVPVMEAINAVPDLKSWQEHDHDRFALAKYIDDAMRNDPAWENKSLTERFTEVAKRTRAAYGEESEPPQVKTLTPTPPPSPPPLGDVSHVAAEKLASATVASQIPNSPSELGVTTAHTLSPLEQAANASMDELQVMFAGMTDAQIEALLEQTL
ncbi:TPA: hypothetical protein PXO92_002957 [Yersinia enterocolitica]|nr:hypothetical protein [Yersinia enterocolitica]